ncbi:Clp protease N-terminal domain-containing protein [Euzebya sp.]|uniref:Clp protease N-terminal domain-containing protein n=1 Tax=Euzebya sp. TaxID=1971409 RepID=UPI00351922B9
MFERFTDNARDVVVRAQQVARDLGQRTIRPTDILLAMAEGTDQMAGDILRTAGLDGPRLREHLRHASDAAVLRTLGIDLDAVRDQVAETFGDGALERAARKPKGHIPFTKPAKKVLELSLRESLARKDGYIGTEHILLALFREGGEAADLLRASGIDRGLVEQGIAERRAAA